MTIRADNEPKFYFRFKLIGLIAIGFAVWCLYDGCVAWPNQRERGLAFERLMEEGRGDEWDEFARQRDWPSEYPGEPKSEVDIKMQFVMAGIAGTVGLVALLAVWRSRGRWIEASDAGITSSWGQSLDFGQIVSLDKRQWRSKGIARVYYDDAGRRKKFVIDDYKFLRQPTDAILRLLESKIGTDRITGGPPESTGEPLDAAESTSDPSGPTE